MKEDEDVTAPSGVVYDNNGTRRGSGSERVKGRKSQEAVEAWQGLKLEFVK